MSLSHTIHSIKYYICIMHASIIYYCNILKMKSFYCMFQKVIHALRIKAVLSSKKLNSLYATTHSLFHIALVTINKALATAFFRVAIIYACISIIIMMMIMYIFI